MTTPQLLKVLQDKVPQQSPFSKPNFIQFLVCKHCVENFECYSEISNIISHLDSNPIKQWSKLYIEYIENDSLNLPESISNCISKFEIPDVNILNEILDVLVNYLFTSYCEFTSQVTRVSSQASSRTNSTNSFSPPAAGNFDKIKSNVSLTSHSAVLIESESWGNKLSRKITRWRRSSNTSSNSTS